MIPCVAGAVDLRVYSEFQRVDPFGQVLEADRAAQPREILSPAVVRNAFTSFHVAVTGPPKEMYFLAVQTNPPNVFRWTLYEEKFVKAGERWIPDTLEEAREPFFGVLPDPAAAIPGQTTRVYLLDVWVPWNAPVGKVRLEVLAKTDHWVLSPMEVRVLPAIVPKVEGGKPAALPEVAASADEAARAVLRAGASGVPAEMTLRAVIRRNAVQDLALMQALKVQWEPPARGAAGAETYLRLRDRIYREASR